MHHEPLTLPGEEQGGFRKSFLVVLAAHVVLILIAWVCARLFFKSHKPEQITWLDGGGEIGSAALPLPESGDTSPSVKAPDPEPQVLPPLPPDPLPAPKELGDLAMLKKTTPTPPPKRSTPKPKPKPTATPTPAKKTAKHSTPKPTATPSHAKNVAKVATPKPGAKPAAQKITDSNAKADGAGTGSRNAASGSGNATNAGTKGGPGAPDGSTAVLTAYFKKVEMQFHREWEQPLTVARSGHDVEAHVRLRAAADGTVESLKLVKPTGNLEVDQSIEQALQRVKKVDKPPAELLKNGVLDELVAFILEL